MPKNYTVTAYFPGFKEIVIAKLTKPEAVREAMHRNTIPSGQPFAITYTAEPIPGAA